MKNLATERKTGAAFPSPYQFNHYGNVGNEVSEIFPHVAQCVDDLAVIRSMHADVPNHEPSLLLMNCGNARLIRPEHGIMVDLRAGHGKSKSAGLYRDVPRRLSDPGIAELAIRFPAGRLPRHVHRHQHREIEQLIEHIRNPQMSAMADQRRQLDLLRELNQHHHNSEIGILNWKRGSTRSNWHTGCRSRRPKPSMFRGNQPQFVTCTVPERSGPTDPDR